MTVAIIAVGTEIGVLTAITGHGLIPPVGGTSRHRSGSNSVPHHYYTPRRSENPLTYSAASHPQTRGAPWLRRIHDNRRWSYPRPA
ncbi:hypothetical protein AVEN_71996-1 [Araneus ventricosus]|uniref:Uncharacterized protein n=1 Tax=Araneus ventricosus TaxID=182803 RepID=A0A4Y2DF31_ARAVE|nr:hypothetical protein AVEN_71996-1 [Araneus ventricosus]